MKFHSATEENLNQSNFSKMHRMSYGACEHETRSGLWFEEKQIQVAPESHDIIWRKKSFAEGNKIWISNTHENLGPEKQVRVIEKSE